MAITKDAGTDYPQTGIQQPCLDSTGLKSLLEAKAAKNERIIDLADGLRNFVQDIGDNGGKMIKKGYIEDVNIGRIDNMITILGDLLLVRSFRGFGINKDEKLNRDDAWELLKFYAERSTLNPKNNQQKFGLDKDQYMHFLAVDMVVSRGIKRFLRLTSDDQTFDSETKEHLALLSNIADWVEEIHEPKIEEYGKEYRIGQLQSQVRTGLPPRTSTQSYTR